MKPEPAASQCVEALARLEAELSVKLDELLNIVLAADEARARLDLWIWCAIAGVMASGLTMTAALVASIR